MLPQVMEFKEPVPMCPNCGTSVRVDVPYERPTTLIHEDPAKYVERAEDHPSPAFTHRVCKVCWETRTGRRTCRTWTPGREP